MIPPKPRSWQRAAPWFGAVTVLLVGYCAWPYTVDDAFIVARYARNLASGIGYSLDGQVRSDAVTGPLWLLPGVLASWFGGDPVGAAKLVGLLAMAAASWLVLRRLSQRALGSRYVAMAMVLLACQPTLGCWGVAGLETGAATLALCVAVLAASRRPQPQLAALGVCLALLAWLRPELALSGAVLLAWSYARCGVRAHLATLLAGAGVASVCVARRVLFGAYFPLSYYAKLGTLSQGLHHVATAAFVLAGLFGLLLPVAACTRGRSDDRLMAAVAGAQVLACVLVGGDWMPGFRLLAPLVPLYVSLCAVGAVRLCATRLGRVSALLCGLFACAVPLTDLITRVPEWRAAGHSREQVGAVLAGTLRAHARRVALVDVGYLGYRSGLQVVDLAGITDPEIARLPGGHLDKRIDDALLERRAPDAVLLHSAAPPRLDAARRLAQLSGYPVEQRVARSRWLHEHFRVVKVLHYAAHYEYVLLLRDEAAFSAPARAGSGR